MKICIENGWISDIEQQVYSDMFDWLVDKRVEGHLFVYLRTDYHKCADRIRKRARAEEATIPLDLLHNLEKKHDAWLLSDEMKPKVLVLDNNGENTDNYASHIEKVLETVAGMQQEN